jgi:hypothetical protein
MYFPRNWEFGSALSKLQNFGGRGWIPQTPLGTPLGPRAGLDGCGKSRPPTGIRSPDRPARSESLYRLSYLGPLWYWGLLRKFVKKIKIRLKLENQIGHLTCRPQYVPLLPATSNRRKSALFDWNGITLLVLPSVRLYQRGTHWAIPVKVDTGLAWNLSRIFISV